MKFGKKNEISVNPLDYNFLLIGESGVGKTTVINEYCKKLVGDIEDSYLFIEVGKEDGGSAINGLPYISAPDWNSDYDEENNTIGFRTLIDDIIENKTDDWKNLKVVIVDTLDELFSITEARVVDMHNRDNPNKRVKSINGAFGGFQAGQDKAVELVTDALWDLKKVGVSFIVIGHTKQKTQTDLETGQEYQQLTTNMPSKYFNAIKTKVHFLGVASIDREIVREKTGKKDFMTKEEIKKGVVKGESRKITFRDDNYNIDSKSRFADIVSSIPLDADELIKALTDAIKAEQAKSGVPYEEAEKKQKMKEEVKEQKVAKAEEQRKKDALLEKTKADIAKFFADNKGNIDIVKPVLMKVREYGYNTPNDITNLEHAEDILAMILKDTK